MAQVIIGGIDDTETQISFLQAVSFLDIMNA
jgi:hypothetical protein